MMTLDSMIEVLQAVKSEKYVVEYRFLKPTPGACNDWRTNNLRAFFVPDFVTFEYRITRTPREWTIDIWDNNTVVTLPARGFGKKETVRVREIIE